MMQPSQTYSRLINLLYETALVFGFAEQKKPIGARIVVEVARNNQKSGIFPGQRKSNGGDPGIEGRAPASPDRKSVV